MNTKELSNEFIKSIYAGLAIAMGGEVHNFLDLCGSNPTGHFRWYVSTHFQ